MEIVLNPIIEKNIAEFIRNPGHALLLSGSLGSGKAALAKYIASKILTKSTGKLDVHPYFMHLNNEKGTISINEIRRLNAFTNLKTPGNELIRRIVLIEEAQNMTIEAQNALLKILEEPPADTLFLLSSSDDKKLLPTVLSRVQQLTLNPPSDNQLTKYFLKKGYSEKQTKYALSLSNGLPGLMTAILESDDKHDLTLQIKEAKKLLSLTMFERLTMVNDLAKRKEELPNLLLAFRRICRAKLIGAAETGQDSELKKWHSKLSYILQIEMLLPNNPQTKLLLTNLLLNI